LALNQKKSSSEIYQVAKQVWAKRGLGEPASRQDVQTADADVLKDVNDALESGVI
jgi:hypothetical protein